MTIKVIRSLGRHAVRAQLAGARIGGRVLVRGVRTGIRRHHRVPRLPDLPPGRLVDLPGRGEVFAVDTGAPHPGAPTLLLFHGLATTSYLSWFTSIEDLSASYRVVMLDQRWHGRGIVSERFLLEECVDDAAALLDVLGIDEVVAVGYSMGGALAQLFWRRHRERTAGLVLASTLARWRSSRGDLLFYSVLELANVPLRGHYRRRVETVRTALPDPGEPGMDLSEWAWGEFRSTSAWALPEVLGALGGFDARSWLGAVDVPTAVVVTARDRALSTRRQRQLAALIPTATLHEAPGGHTSVVFDVEHWLPVFLAAVADVVARTGHAAPLQRERRA
ncbi:alpha/beta fold hydrolase [Nocardioides sp. zg-536]|uniref:Alpha/beta fold hydrolase n=1 Tax=Nocardioides faecalis TaxID=2803858 RepID=A0A938Y8N8_9ACTN|nr:alpha/beta fold hydrolase [Nocardioides faecalis]MBM9461227.1 alpha/beta fold hydrolase [Nocardioides faecalis]MBS4752468.1 alpha/beta fold hydrolase [Nocardioides faecalis]QVI57748.1 alpha/beta fold hydrolase [Nocardioides faecalis]